MSLPNEGQHFAVAIGLIDSWPMENSDKTETSIAGLLMWAETYFSAAELLHSECKEERNSAFYAGPVMQNVGLSTELTMKALLRGTGISRKELRAFSHNTYEAYCVAKDFFDEQKFINLFLANTEHMLAPEEIRNRLMADGESDVDVRWRIYFDHLRILDTVYDRPYRGRYVTPGKIILPETELILIGTKILLSAMRERLPS
ncbi:MAG: hypothetical protein OEM91_17185 [Hyphomicrobiales bacterium]|nr:hypothetical protein [Hyphomicrobiales bacterium]